MPHSARGTVEVNATTGLTEPERRYLGFKSSSAQLSELTAYF